MTTAHGALLAVATGLAVLAAGDAAAAERIGIDVSHHSGAIDWDRVEAADYAFVYLKATEGVDDADPAFEGHWRRLARARVARGAYHFYVTEDDPEDQARFFLSKVDLRPGDLAPVVDVEVLGHGTRGDLRGRLRRFLDVVQGRVGVPPVIYTGARFWNAHLGDGFEDFPLWIAEYDVESPTLPEGWPRWHLWQYQADVAVPGVEKGVDRSRLHPDLDLDALRIPTAP